jgi:multidrug efflux pump subunit AcrB
VNSPKTGSSGQHWIAQHSRPVIFLILTMALLGGYLAFTIPVSVFPSTNFPRVLVAVDNGVMPIDQMMVTVTRPIEEAVNSVPGLLCSTSMQRSRACSLNCRRRPRSKHTG